jgi:hypothetical protein
MQRFKVKNFTGAYELTVSENGGTVCLVSGDACLRFQFDLTLDDAQRLAMALLTMACKEGA